MAQCVTIKPMTMKKPCAVFVTAVCVDLNKGTVAWPLIIREFMQGTRLTLPQCRSSVAAASPFMANMA